MTSDPETWRSLLAIRSEYQRADWFDHLRLNPRRASLISERDRRVHKALRYQLASGVCFYDK